MENQIDQMILHMAKSQRELARILKAERELTAHAAGLMQSIPETHTAASGLESVRKQSEKTSKSIASYLNGLADLEEALADNLRPVMKGLEETEDE